MGLPVLAFDAGDARCTGELRAALSRLSTPIGPYNSLIAGQPLARDLNLVTRNTGESSRIPGPRIGDCEL